MHNATALRGGGAFFECRVISDLTPYIVWYKHYELNGSYVNATGEAYANTIEVCLLIITTIIITASMYINNHRSCSAMHVLVQVQAQRKKIPNTTASSRNYLKKKYEL